MLHEAVLVGNTQGWLPELCERAKKLNVSQGFEERVDLCVTSEYHLSIVL